MALDKQHCVPCEGGTKPLSKNEAALYHQEAKGWQLHDDFIERDFEFKDFKQAMAFINKVAEVAEAEGHHPDIYVFYNKVHFKLTTHAIGGLSINDFILAVKIDQVKV